jgi:hypothetical protein
MMPAPIGMVQQANLALAEQIAEFYDDPLGHVLFSYPWGEGELRAFEGPRIWQRDFLIEVGNEVRRRGFDGANAVPPIQFSTASGHGIGKSALVAWIIRWIMDTRPYAVGTVTANTAPQLKTKTWAELSKWHAMGITRHWWGMNTSQGNLNYFNKDYPDTWRVDAYTCKEENSARRSPVSTRPTPRSFYIFDEASADARQDLRGAGGRPDRRRAHDVRLRQPDPEQRALLPEPCEGRFRQRYIRREIDSRDVEGTNKELFDQWLQDWGENSDFFKVRVRGQFPDQGSLQLIPMSYYEDNVDIDMDVTPRDPLILGLDVARFGDDSSVLWCRQGRDATIEGADERTPGHWIWHKIDTMTLAAKCAEIAVELRPDAFFVDGGGVGGGVIDRLRQLGIDVIEVNFGSKPTEKGYANMRAQMWGRMRDALRAGIRLPYSEDLRTDLTSLEYGYNSKMELQLESKEDAKKRGLASPDLADALALTFALPVFPNRSGYKGQQNEVKHDYDPI